MASDPTPPAALNISTVPVLSERPPWRAAFSVVLLCHSATFFAYNAAFPFISLYVQELGVDRASAAVWAGAVNSSTTAVVALMNPIWGTLADRWGVKAGLVRSLALGVLGLLICGLAQSPEQLLAGRMVQSIGGGVNAAALIVVGAIVPASSAGMSMGLMQTGQSLAGSLGPAVGGFLGDRVGFRFSFFGSAVLSAFVTLAVWHFVREPPRPARPRHTESFAVGVRYVASHPVLGAMVFLMFIFHVGYQAVWTYIPLRMQELIGPDRPAGQWSGAALLGDTLGIAVGAALIGWLSRRWSSRRLVIGVCGLACVASAAQLAVTLPEQMVAVRVVIGFCYGGVIPLVRAALGHYSDAQRRGIAMGVAQGAFAAGFSLGSLSGSLIIGVLDLPGAFALSSIVFVVTTVWAVLRFPPPRAAVST